jgi:hypothetical protein
MSRAIEVTVFGTVLCALLLTAGCRKSDKERYSSPSFMIENTIGVIDALKMVLPTKDIHQLAATAGQVSGALANLPTYATSAAGKAKAQKAIEMFEKEVNPAVLSLQYDPAAMARKLDEIRAIVLEVGKEVK